MAKTSKGLIHHHKSPVTHCPSAGLGASGAINSIVAYSILTFPQRYDMAALALPSSPDFLPTRPIRYNSAIHAPEMNSGSSRIYVTAFDLLEVQDDPSLFRLPGPSSTPGFDLSRERSGRSCPW